MHCALCLGTDGAGDRREQTAVAAGRRGSPIHYKTTSRGVRWGSIYNFKRQNIVRDTKLTLNPLDGEGGGEGVREGGAVCVPFPV